MLKMTSNSLSKIISGLALHWLYIFSSYK